MKRKAKTIAVVSYLGLVGALGATTALADHTLGSHAGPGLTTQKADAAPAFTLRSADGKTVTLEQLRGEDGNNIVVLEWFDPDCDWVKTYHASSTTISDLRTEFRALGVHWAAIYSSTPPGGGDPAELNRKAAQRWGIDYPVLLDNDRSVAELYKVTRAPTAVVISADGQIIYKGPVDNAGEPGAPGDKHYLRDAINAALHAEKPQNDEITGSGCQLQAETPTDQH